MRFGTRFACGCQREDSSVQEIQRSTTVKDYRPSPIRRGPAKIRGKSQHFGPTGPLLASQKIQWKVFRMVYSHWDEGSWRGRSGRGIMEGKEGKLARFQTTRSQNLIINDAVNVLQFSFRGGSVRSNRL